MQASLAGVEKAETVASDVSQQKKNSREQRMLIVDERIPNRFDATPRPVMGIRDMRPYV